MSINYLAVLICGIIYMALGMLWYSPILFGRQWAKMMGYEMPTKEKKAEMQKKVMPAYIVSFVGGLLMVYVLAHFIQYTSANSPLAGALTGLWIWLGFVATTSLSGVMFAQKPLKLWIIDSFYVLVELLISGIILAVWK